MMGAFSDNKENCPVCERVNERPLTESEPYAAALQENQALQATFQSTYCFRAGSPDSRITALRETLLSIQHRKLPAPDGWIMEIE